MGISDTSIDLTVLKPTIEIQASRNGQNGSLSAVIGLLRAVVCEHQGSIVEHIYWGAELHKKLREAADEFGIDTKEARTALEKIDSDLPSIFKNAWLLSVNHLRRYFESTHNSEIVPRMCIKSTNNTEEGQHIIDLFREDGGTSRVTHEIYRNTGFQTVIKKGKYYKCNNIPLAARQNEYFNPRLNPTAAKIYKPSLLSKIARTFRKKEIDSSWCKCWNDYSHESGNEASCYKSTLIIPMTLINNNQSSTFLNHTMVGVSKDARNIYGFLCFDHPSAEYFTENDVNIGYIFADLLSFYLVNQLNFSTFSRTYDDVARAHRGSK